MTQEPDPRRKAGVIGWPVAHSLSPVIHRYWLRKYGIEGDYDLIPVSPEKAEGVIRNLTGLGYCGANVTIPHKLTALRVADRATDRARRIGAVNTLFYGDGLLIGDNSDAEGFLRNLTATGPGWSIEDGTAVVLGAGGASRAVIVALSDAGVRSIRLLNRTRERAEELQHLAPGITTVVDWEDRSSTLVGASLLVNATSLGMVGNPPLEIDLARLPTDAVVNDIVYRPLETSLLAAARSRGNRVVDGLGMLLYQACPGFRVWFGHEPEVTDELRQMVLEAAG